MVNSYDDMMGSPMDPSEHEVANVPQATEHYAGDVVSFPSPSPVRAIMGQALNETNTASNTSKVTPIKKKIVK